VVQGAELVALSLAPAFGPAGKRVSVTMQELGRRMAFSRGARIAQRIKSGDPLKAHGVEQMARLAQEVWSSVGDATKTSVFLSAAMLSAGDAALRSGHSVKGVLSGMQRAVETAAAFLMTEARPVTAEQLKGVALSACAFDHAIADVVVEALRRAGKDGVVEIVEGSGGDRPQLDVQEGMHFDQGYLSPFFVTDPERQECVLENCYILICERPLASMKELLPVLEKVANSGKPLLVISQDVSGEALATLVVNKQRGTFSCAAVKAPAAGEHRSALLQDIAILTNGKAFLPETTGQLDGIGLRDLGRAKKVIVSKGDTTIIGGSGTPAEIADRIKLLRVQLSGTTNPRDAERLRERLAMLGGAIAVIRAPGDTDEDLADFMYRLESALRSCHSAIENGFVIGGGVALCRLKAQLEKLVAKDASDKAGIDAVAAALVIPLGRVLENSQRPNPEAVVNEVLDAPDGKTGFNAESNKVEDLAASGVLDSAKALTQALTLAFAYATGVLRTAAWDTTPISEGGATLR
jgi:chaperonin GroEL